MNPRAVSRSDSVDFHIGPGEVVVPEMVRDKYNLSSISEDSMTGSAQAPSKKLFSSKAILAAFLK